MTLDHSDTLTLLIYIGINSTAIAKTHPHSAYGAFVHGILHKWNYVMRTIESVGSLFEPLEMLYINILLFPL